MRTHCGWTWRGCWTSQRRNPRSGRLWRGNRTRGPLGAPSQPPSPPYPPTRSGWSNLNRFRGIVIEVDDQTKETAIRNGFEHRIQTNGIEVENETKKRNGFRDEEKPGSFPRSDRWKRRGRTRFDDSRRRRSDVNGDQNGNDRTPTLINWIKSHRICREAFTCHCRSDL